MGNLVPFNEFLRKRAAKQWWREAKAPPLARYVHTMTPGLAQQLRDIDGKIDSLAEVAAQGMRGRYAGAPIEIE